MTIGFLRRIRVRLAPEGGFTLVELMVALGVILLALLAMAYTATIGFSDISLARQRQTATGLANEAMERVRALSFDKITAGHANSDLQSAQDGLITVTGTEYRFRGERMPHSTFSGSVKARLYGENNPTPPGDNLIGKAEAPTSNPEY